MPPENLERHHFLSLLRGRFEAEGCRALTFPGLSLQARRLAVRVRCLARLAAKKRELRGRSLKKGSMGVKVTVCGSERSSDCRLRLPLG